MANGQARDRRGSPLQDALGAKLPAELGRGDHHRPPPQRPRQRAAVRGRGPGITRRGRLLASGAAAAPMPGQVLNERGEYEDEESYRRRGAEAFDSICDKLLRCRRLFLAEISASAGKRAAFEILTELPVDWDRAARLEPQPDEPWNRANQRQPDMILTAESGWTMGEHGYGPDKVGEIQRAIDEHRAEMGLDPIDWSESESAECKLEHRVSGGQPSSQVAESEASSADGSLSEPDRRHVGFTPRDEPSPSRPSRKERPGPRLRGL